MIKKILIMVFVCLFLITPVCADQITMQVDSKHIEGMGCGYTPIVLDDFCLPMYIISERIHDGVDRYITQEYPVSYTDYYKIQVGQTVTLETPEYGDNPCKVVSIK